MEGGKKKGKGGKRWGYSRYMYIINVYVVSTHTMIAVNFVI
jgi:hypothetical protein